MLTIEQTMGAVLTMQSLIPFFPTESVAIEIIAGEIMKIVEDPEKLQWLTETACIKMPRWGSEYQSGLGELRGLYCWRYRPVDGVEGWSSLPGYRAGDSEAAHMAAIASPEAAGLLPAPADSGFTVEEIAEN